MFPGGSFFVVRDLIPLARQPKPKQGNRNIIESKITPILAP